jgi:hypothetical protein
MNIRYRVELTAEARDQLLLQCYKSSLPMRL